MMGFRFQRRIRILPGVTLVLSKSGVSLSIGFPGFSFNIGRGRTMTTMSLPGTGLSHRTVSRRGSYVNPEAHRPHDDWFGEFLQGWRDAGR